MPKLAAVPKAYMTALCKDGSMTIREWIDLAASLPLDGVEWYAGFQEMAERSRWPEFRAMATDAGLAIPMLCCSPDFTHPDPEFRREQIALETGWIEMARVLGAGYCRVLSGQRRPGLSREDGIGYTIECIEACLPAAADADVTLIIENHYKDDFWSWPEFAQPMDIFCDIVDRIDHPNFGVNYDPSNTILAGEDPLELLGRISDRVVTMHASDRYLAEGTLEDLRREEVGVEGYAARLRHGEVGRGLNDYDAILTELRRAGFDGWISIEDGVDGFEQLRGSVAFLRRKIAEYWP